MAKQDYLNFSTTQMYYFIEVVECKSFTVAAQNLYTTQSTLSKTVSTLEKNLNVQLFYRNYKRLIPTEAGWHLYDQWKQSLFDMEKNLNESRILQGGYGHALSIGSLDSWLPESCIYVVIQKFAQIYPDCKVNVYTYSAQDIRRNLFNDKLDLVFTVRYDLEELSSEEFEIMPITECTHYVCMQLDNPLALKEELDIEDLKDCGFVTISPTYVPTYCGMIEKLCEEHGFSPLFVRYTNSARALALNMMGPDDIFICDKYYCDFGATGFAFRPIKDTKSGIMAAWKKNYDKPELEKFLKILKDVAGKK